MIGKFCLLTSFVVCGSTSSASNVKRCHIVDSYDGDGCRTSILFGILLSPTLVTYQLLPLVLARPIGTRVLGLRYTANVTQLLKCEFVA